MSMGQPLNWYKVIQELQLAEGEGLTPGEKLQPGFYRL